MGVFGWARSQRGRTIGDLSGRVLGAVVPDVRFGSAPLDSEAPPVVTRLAPPSRLVLTRLVPTPRS